jgi:hypothetical protein
VRNEGKARQEFVVLFAVSHFWDDVRKLGRKLRVPVRLIGEGIKAREIIDGLSGLWGGRGRNEAKRGSSALVTLVPDSLISTTSRGQDLASNCLSKYFQTCRIARMLKDLQLKRMTGSCSEVTIFQHTRLCSFEAPYKG